MPQLQIDKNTVTIKQFWDAYCAQNPPHPHVSRKARQTAFNFFVAGFSAMNELAEWSALLTPAEAMAVRTRIRKQVMATAGT